MSRKLATEADSAAIIRLPCSAPLKGNIRGVLFELCNVLYDDTVWRLWVLRVLAQLGLHTNYRSFFHVWGRDYMAEVHRGQKTFGEAFRAFLLSAGLSPGQIDEVEAACRARRLELQRTARLLPGVKSTLARLYNAGMVLAAVADSERPAAVIEEQLQRFAAGKMFTAVVSSIDLGRTMPDAVCYQSALHAMNLPAGEVAFVGHDTTRLAGAAAVGMSTVAVNYQPGVEADVYVTRFDELLDLFGPPRAMAAAG